MIRSSLSGKKRVANQIPITPIGTLIRNIQCHEKKVVMKPPTGGPTNGPTIAGIVSHAMAETSSLLGVERMRTNRPTGVIIAPPMPCKNLATTKAASELDAAQASEPTTKIAIAARKTFLAPNRSAIHPLTGIKTARETR